MTTNWKILDGAAYDEAWDKFYELYNFNPSVYEKDWPAISTRLPTLKLSAAHFLPSANLEERMTQLENLAIRLFQQVTGKGETMYALNWQHDCYIFDPREPMDRNQFDEWTIPVFPNGDYYIFLTKDIQNVWFGHPWEETITLIGEKMTGDRQQLLTDFEKIGITLYKTSTLN